MSGLCHRRQPRPSSCRAPRRPSSPHPDYLVFRRGESLMAQHFDVNELVVTGDPVRVADEVFPLGDLFSTSSDGGLAYVGGGGGSLTQLQWVGRSGEPLGRVGQPGNYSNPVLSPDDTRIAVVRDGDIWVLYPVRGTEERLTTYPGPDSYPVWSPDGRSIVFSSLREGGRAGLYEKSALGAGDAGLLMTSDSTPLPMDWSAARAAVVYSEPQPATSFDLWELAMPGDPQPRGLVVGPFWESGGVVSPDGRWFAYYSSETGVYEVYVLRLSESGERMRISTAGGIYPRWRGDGRELYYATADNELMAVDVQVDGDTLAAEIPRRLFEVDFRTTGPANNRFDVTADGQRFLVNTRVEEGAVAPITWVLSWTADLEQ